VLTDRGLAPALQTLAERSAVPVDLDVDFDERLPAAVEVAIFYVVSESLANVAKYAGATRVNVSAAHAGDVRMVPLESAGGGGCGRLCGRRISAI
jgi:signal transduction histidine kinase